MLHLPILFTDSKSYPMDIILYPMLASDQGLFINDGHAKPPKNIVHVLEPGLCIYFCNFSNYWENRTQARNFNDLKNELFFRLVI